MIENGDVTENGNIENAKVTYFIFSFHYLLLELYRLLKNFQRFKLLSPKTSVNKKKKPQKKSTQNWKPQRKKKKKKRTKKERKINDRDRAKRFGNAKDRACSCMEFY